MGVGGSFNLINASPYNWTRTGFNQYQMVSWDFPERLNSGEVYGGYVEYSDGVFSTLEDDYGDLTYSFDGAPNVHIFVRAERYDEYASDTSMNIYVELTKSSGDVARTDLGFRHDGSVDYVVVGVQDNVYGNDAPVDWMHSSLAVIGDMTLSQVSIAGSHDSGMAVDNGGTFFASDANAKTQVLSINDQLTKGTRWFDIRPVVSDGRWVCGHYGYTGSFVKWQGRNGQYIDEVVDQVNSFLATNKELVVLEISHGLQTDDNYRDLTSDEWNDALDQFLKLKNVYVLKQGDDFFNLTMNDFIGSQGAVILISRDYEPPSSYVQKGVYGTSSFPYGGSYADKGTPQEVIDDQINKLKTWREGRPDAKYFQLSWTVTLQGADNVFSTILDGANSIKGTLAKNLIPVLSKTAVANSMLIDYVIDKQVAVTAMASNYLYKTRYE
ncbi:PLC-like phosphodiesterase [Phlyctema vagabunda]|uniref:PLC-like phosphodiesterase n=1 Tax=Phlyctema vagabunda TaxID=108571 RepID=A0ABR4PFB1_9HELO